MKTNRTGWTAFDTLVADEVIAARMYYMEDFHEGANALASTTIAKDYWTGGGTSGTQAVIAGINGIIELDTTTTGSRTSTLTFTNANFQTNSNPTLETLLQLSNITNTKCEFGWYASSNDYLLFRFDTAVDAGNLYSVSKNNGGTEVVVKTGLTLTAAKNYKFRIEMYSNETFKMFINDILVDNTGMSIKELATFKPYFYVDNKSAAESKKLDIDYVYISQDRA